MNLLTKAIATALADEFDKSLLDDQIESNHKSEKQVNSLINMINKGVLEKLECPTINKYYDLRLKGKGISKSDVYRKHGYAVCSIKFGKPFTGGDATEIITYCKIPKKAREKMEKASADKVGKENVTMELVSKAIKQEAESRKGQSSPEAVKFVEKLDDGDFVEIQKRIAARKNTIANDEYGIENLTEAVLDDIDSLITEKVFAKTTAEPNAFAGKTAEAKTENEEFEEA